MWNFEVSDEEVLGQLLEMGAYARQLRRRVLAGQMDVKTALWWMLLREQEERRKERGSRLVAV